jgi:hypothetical protein
MSYGLLCIAPMEGLLLIGARRPLSLLDNLGLGGGEFIHETAAAAAVVPAAGCADAVPAVPGRAVL